MQENTNRPPVLCVDPVTPEQDLIKQAAEKLKAGRAVVFPTDTVYGIGIMVSETGTPDELARIKHRPQEKTIPLLVNEPDALSIYGVHVPGYATELAKHHWPGALTLVVQASERVPRHFIASDGSIALRMPSHPITRALLAAVQQPLATSSANLSNQPPATSVSELDAALVKEVALIVDGGKLQGTAASTVVSCLQAEPQVLRQGPVKIGVMGE